VFVLPYVNQKWKIKIRLAAQDHQIMIISKRDRQLTASETTSEINESDLKPVLVTTVKRRLNEADLFGRIANKKPFLRIKNKSKGLS
jgi:Lhr-like helicase